MMRTYRYHSFEDDFVESADQGHGLPEGYEWVRGEAVCRAGSAALYGLALPVAAVYMVASLRWRIDNGEALKAAGERGLLLYCNHTQPVGDALAPALAAFPRRAYVVVSTANLGIPHLGKLLPALGALPVPSTLSGTRKLRAAVSQRLDEGSVVAVYPEAHVWPYCTFVRPYPATSFAFAVDNRVPAFCMTTTYHSRAFGGKPRAVAHIDGPFWPDASLPKKRAREKLCDQVRERMVERARENEYEYVRYVEAADADARGRRAPEPKGSQADGSGAPCARSRRSGPASPGDARWAVPGELEEDAYEREAQPS